MGLEEKTDSHVFTVACRGINTVGKEALEKPVEIYVTVYTKNKGLAASVGCPYITQRDKCDAPHTNHALVRERKRCIYTFFRGYEV